MPPQTFLTIATFPGQVIELSCARCRLRSTHSKMRLARRYGLDFAIPELVLALSASCPLRGGAQAAQCGAGLRFPGMSPPHPPLGSRDGKAHRPLLHPAVRGWRQRPMR